MWEWGRSYLQISMSGGQFRLVTGGCYCGNDGRELSIGCDRKPEKSVAHSINEDGVSRYRTTTRWERRPPLPRDGRFYVHLPVTGPRDLARRFVRLVTVLVVRIIMKRRVGWKPPEREHCERREVFPNAAAELELFQRYGQLPDREAFCWPATSQAM
jgi:hypothetical protein